MDKCKRQSKMKNEKMSMGKYIVNSALCFAVATLISCGIVGILRDGYNWSVVLYCFIASAISAVWFYNKKTFLIGSGILLTNSALILFSSIGSRIKAHIVEFLLWAPSEMFLVNSDYCIYTEISIIIIASVISLLIYVIAVKLKQVALVAVITTAVLCVAYYYIGAIEYNVFSSEAINIGLVLAVAIFAFWINYAKNSKGNYVTATGFVAVMLIIILLVSPNVISVRGNSNINNLIASFINKTSTVGESQHEEVPSFTISMSGFASSENKKLGGNMMIDKRLAFVIYSKSPRLLRGAVYDIYTGKTWLQRSGNVFLLDDGKGYDANASYTERYSQTYYYTLYSINKLYQKNIENYKIFKQEKPTRIMLTDVGTVHIGFNKKKNIYSNYSTVFTKDPMEYDDAYTVTCISADYSKTGLSEYTKNNKLPSKYEYPSEISRYQDTTGIPQSVIELAEKILSNASSASLKSDIDVAWRIKKYLEVNYQYSTKVVAVPENVDFVEHFLFDTKTGYCTYFATAMTLLCRAAGLPARYVEGYRSDGVSISNVYNSNAHAWTEVFINNVGWVPIDLVTSDDFSQNLPQTGTNVDPNITKMPIITTPTPSPSATAGVSSGTSVGTTETVTSKPSVTVGTTASEATTVGPDDQKNQNIFLLCTCVIISCGGFVFFVLTTKQKKANKIKRLCKRMYKKDVNKVYQCIISDAKKLGFKYSEDMTVDETINNLYHYCTHELQISMEKQKIDNAIWCINEVLYSNKYIGDDRTADVMYLYNEICGRVAQKRGIILDAFVYIFRRL